MSAAEATLRVVTMRSRPCWNTIGPATCGGWRIAWIVPAQNEYWADDSGRRPTWRDFGGAEQSTKFSEGIIQDCSEWPNWRSRRFSIRLRSLMATSCLRARLLGIGKTTLYRKLKEYAVPQKAAIRSFSSFS